MAQLNCEARAYLTSDDAISEMMSRDRALTVASTKLAVDYALPLVVDGLRRRAEDSAGYAELLSLVRSLDMSQFGTPARLGSTRHRSGTSSELLEVLFRDEHGNAYHETIVWKLAERARIRPASSSGILGSCVWMMLAVIVNRHTRLIDSQALLQVAEQERISVSDQGWDPWIRLVERERSAMVGGETTGTSSLFQDSLGSARVSVQTGPKSQYPPPASRDYRRGRSPQSALPKAARSRRLEGGIGHGGTSPPDQSQALSDDGLLPGGYYAAARSATYRRPVVQLQPTARHVRPRAARKAEFRARPIAFTAAALLLVGGSTYWLVGRNGENASVDEAVVATSNEADSAGDGGPVDDGEAEADSRDDEGVDDVTPTYSGLVTLEVPVKDTVSFDSTQASGTARITIDSFSGETCALTHTVNLPSPYNSHLHLGSSLETGPLVVDFMPMTDGIEQCVTNDIDDINEILSDRTEYYMMLHHHGGNFVVRGQLSEATTYEDLRDPASIPKRPNESNLLDTDPNQTASVVRFEGASLIVQGAVKSEAIADTLIAALEASGVPVVNELRIETTAPLFSGRFVANTGLTFDVDQDQLHGDNSAVLETMAAVIEANPTWKLTIIGHTDDTGNRAANLELSTRRAKSVRNAMENLGVAADVLKIAGFGPDQPVGDNDTAQGRQRNRRIEFVIDPT